MSEPFEFEAAPRPQSAAELARATQRATAHRLDRSEEAHLLDYIRVIYKRRWLAGTVFSVVMLAVIVYVFTATPIYEGRVQLLIEADDPNIVTFKEVIDQDQAKADYYQTQYRLLRSRTLAAKTLTALSLWGHDELAFRSNRKLLSRWLPSLFPAKAAAVVDPSDAAVTPEQSRTIDQFLDRLTVAPVRNSRLVDVAYRSRDPKLSASVSNSLAKAYVELNLEFKFTASKEASDWLTERLAEQRRAVEAGEAALQGYREQNDALSLDQRQNIVVQKLADLNAAVTRAKTERIQKEALYMQLRGIQNNRGALDTFPAVLSNNLIQQQKADLATLQRELGQAGEKLGDRHPDIIKMKSAIQIAEAKLQGEIGKVVQSVRNEYMAAQAQENSLTAALNQQKAEALGMNRKGIEYGVLERDAESNRQIYNSLLQRAKETGVSGELKTSNIRVVDAASVPVDPVSPRRGLSLLIALFVAAFAGVGLAFFFEYLDNRIKTPDEIVKHLGLPALGMVPVIRGDKLTHTEPLVNNGVPPQFAEAFRTLRTNVLFSGATEGCRSIVVTSTGPGEGKTMVGSNLAIGFAQAGQRVLLIDGDMRRPRVHEVFGIRQEPGLSNVMVGTTKASEAIRRTTTANLWVLPAGKIPPNPAELLGSSRFNDFLVSLGSHFDWVILDTPPVMAVADASLVANSASGVVFVVGAEMTSRHGARAALDQLERSHARFIGAVLNRVDFAGHGYYYAPYYRKEYADYYVSAS